MPEDPDLKRDALRSIEGAAPDALVARLGIAIAEHLAREVGPRFDPPAILREKVTAGHLGRKSGHGFYTWPT